MLFFCSCLTHTILMAICRQTWVGWLHYLIFVTRQHADVWYCVTSSKCFNHLIGHHFSFFLNPTTLQNSKGNHISKGVKYTGGRNRKLGCHTHWQTSTHFGKCTSVADLKKTSPCWIWSFCIKWCKHKYRRIHKIGDLWNSALLGWESTIISSLLNLRTARYHTA